VSAALISASWHSTSPQAKVHKPNHGFPMPQQAIPKQKPTPASQPRPRVTSQVPSPHSVQTKDTLRSCSGPLGDLPLTTVLSQLCCHYNVNYVANAFKQAWQCIQASTWQGKNKHADKGAPAEPWLPKAATIPTSVQHKAGQPRPRTASQVPSPHHL
jgi:hypothetical protein